MIPKFAICGCVLDADPADLGGMLSLPGLDLVEWRLDYFLKRYSLDVTVGALSLLSSTDRHPAIATNRPVREGGMFEGDEKNRLQLLRQAAKTGAEWIDIEADVPENELEVFRTTRSKILISSHNFNETPSESALKGLAEQMAKKGADAIKIAAYAHSEEDNLRILGLIPFARRELGTEIVAFCMGPMGLWSRFFCLVLGSLWTYVQLPGQGASAPGQLTLEQARKLLDAGGWMLRQQ